MVNMYDIILYLCERDGIKPGKLCSETGISRGTLSDLKVGRIKSLSLNNMQKIANYFQVSTDIFNDGVFEETIPNGMDLKSMTDAFQKFNISQKSKNTPIPDDNQEIGFDDFTYAMHNEAKNLSQESKDRLLQMARFFAEEERKKGAN